MKYIKHYYVDESSNAFCCELIQPKYKRHPDREFPGLSVKVWLTDSEGVDVCLAELPDTTSVATVASPCGKDAIKVLTKAKYDSVATPYFEAQTLFAEAQQARRDGDETLATQKETEATTKQQAALSAIHSLES